LRSNASQHQRRSTRKTREGERERGRVREAGRNKVGETERGGVSGGARHSLQHPSAAHDISVHYENENAILQFLGKFLLFVMESPSRNLPICHNSLWIHEVAAIMWQWLQLCDSGCNYVTVTATMW
jgi:hypothetical protein